MVASLLCMATDKPDNESDGAAAIERLQQCIDEMRTANAKAKETLKDLGDKAPDTPF